MSVDVTYEILNYFDTAADVYAWLEAIDNAHIPGLGWVPSLDYIPSCILEKFAGKLVPTAPMRDKSIPIYMKYIGMIDWPGVYRRFGNNMDPEFAQLYKEFMPKIMQQTAKGRHVPSRTMMASNISYYIKYAHTINWERTIRKHRHMDPEFAIACADYINWEDSACREIYPSLRLLRAIKDEVHWPYVLCRRKLTEAMLIEFVDYIDWNSQEGHWRACKAGPELLKLIIPKCSRDARLQIIRRSEWYDTTAENDIYGLPVKLTNLLELYVNFPDILAMIFQYANERLGALPIKFVEYWIEKLRNHGVLDAINLALANNPVRVAFR